MLTIALNSSNFQHITKFIFFYFIFLLNRLILYSFIKNPTIHVSFAWCLNDLKENIDKVALNKLNVIKKFFVL